MILKVWANSDSRKAVVKAIEKSTCESVSESVRCVCIVVST
jgi:hypothetical protein